LITGWLIVRKDVIAVLSDADDPTYVILLLLLLLL